MKNQLVLSGILPVLSIFFMIHMPLQAQFQRQFGTNLDESFSKVIPNGPNYYVLGSGEVTNGQPARATVSRLNAQGQLQWTLSMNTGSKWNDAVLTPGGDLLVVGHSLPDDQTSMGIMGRVTASGTFAWLRSYDWLNRDGFDRIVRNPLPENNSLPYYVLGHQLQTLPDTDDVFLMVMTENGTIGWKKIYVSTADDEFTNDLEALPNGDLILAGHRDGQGLIMRASNNGVLFAGATPENPFTFNDVTPASGGGFYAVGLNLQEGRVHLLEFDNDLINLWDVKINDAVEAYTVFEATQSIFVDVRRNSASYPYAKIRLSQGAGGPNLQWVKTLDNGVLSQTAPSSTFLPPTQVAYVDGRTIQGGGFGQNCAFISVSDLDLSTCMTEILASSITPVSTLFNGPLLPEAEFYDVPVGPNLTGSPRTWQEAEVCSTCAADFSFQFPNCDATVSFTNLSTGTGPLSYFWDFGSPSISNSVATNPTVSYPGQCATYNVCLTVTGNGCSDVICKTITIKYPQQPVLTCPPNITVACNTNLSPAITGFATLTGACSALANNTITYSDAISGSMPCNATVLRTWTAMDECGVTRTCVQTIQVRDNVPPVAICAPGQSYDLNPGCTLPVTVAMINGGSTDNCQIQSMSVNPTMVQGCGVFPITLTVMDICGNTSTCMTEIQTIEADPPMIMCPPNLQKDCDTGLTPDITGFATATDHCTLVPTIFYTDAILGTLPCDAVVQRTWTARDDCGNESACIQNIVVMDNVPPVINCPPDQTVNTNPGQCFYNGVLQEPTATDNCNPNPTIACFLVTDSGLMPITPQTQFPKGTHTICCIADDGCVDVSPLICTYPCTSSGMLQEENLPPAIGFNTLNNSAEQEALAVLGVQSGISGHVLVKDVLVGGNCFDITNVTTQGQSSQFSVFSNGMTNIGFNAGVLLTTGPGTLAAGPNNSDNAGSGVGGITPDADLATLTTATLYDRASLEFDFTPTQSVVTFRFAFASEAYCEQAGNPVNDVLGFFISGPGISGGQQNIALLPLTTTPVNINTINHLTNAGIYVNNQPASSGNLCGQTPSSAPAVTELQYDGFTRLLTATANVQPGQTYHLKLAIADAGDDLYDSAVFLDAGSFDAGGNAAVEWEVNSNPVSAIAYENCGTVNLVFDRVGGNINAPMTVLYTISGTATAGLDYAPFASSVVIPAGQGQVTLPVTILNDAIPEGDETIVVTLNDVCSFLMPQKTLTLKDKSLLQAKCTFTLTVEDHELPMIMCVPGVSVTGFLNAQGTCSAVVGNLAPTVSDNCPMLMVDYVITGATTGTGVNDASGTTFLAGTSVVTYTATDMSGNMATCQTVVTVMCVPPPPCQASFAVNFVDNCGHIQLISTSTGPQPISYQWFNSASTPDIDLMLPCGPHTFSVSITCADGSMSSATQTITIVDNIPPTIMCPPDVQLHCFSATTPATTGIGFATATDNCSLLSLTYTDVVTGTQPCNQVITRTWRAEDWCNNVSTCVQTITITDNIPPVLTNCPQNMTVPGVIGANGACTASVQIVSPNAADLCDQAVMLTNSFNGTADASGTYPQGTTTVTWTATDDCANTATCSFDVTVDCGTAICCPEFSLIQLDSIIPCDPLDCRGGDVSHSPIQPGGRKITACKNSTHTYYIVPSLPGFTYTWTVTGGTPASFTGNPGVITWGNGDEGFIEVTITDATGACRDTIVQEVCLIDAPIAGLTVAPGTTVCANQPVTFTSTSVGATTYYWDFGDGTSSTSANPPPHHYSAGGPYTVVLTVSNGPSTNVDSLCGCRDTAMVVINIAAGTGPAITSGCRQMLCPLDTASYCVNLQGCPPYSWTVNGGTIIANNGDCITVQWDAIAPAALPAFVSVTTGCNTPCGNGATLNVPVLWDNMPISGPDPVCIGDKGTYSLPTMPGTFYNWAITPASMGMIPGPNQHTSSINVMWNGPVGTATLTCSYHNPYSGCSGDTSMLIHIRDEFVIVGPDQVCDGDLSVYSVTTGLSPANWTISPASGYTVGPTTSVSNIAVTWTTPGNYTITAVPTNPSVYCNPSSVIQVIVKPVPVITITGPPAACLSQVVNYSATSSLSGGSFTWSLIGTGGTFAPYGPDNSNVAVTFAGSGPWTLTVTQTVNGCTGSATLSIPAVAPPVLQNTPITTCIGGQVPVSVVSGSGPPYTWSSSPAASLIGGQGTATAIYEIHDNGVITVSNCGGTSTPITVSTTQPAVLQIVQTGSLCAGNAQLEATPLAPSGTTYQWFGGGTPISPNYLAVTHPGIYTVQATFPNGCISVATFTVQPEVVPTVFISTGDPLKWCLPSTPMVTLHAFTQSANCSYQWHDANGAISGATTAQYFTTFAGSYFVVVTCGGCVATSNVLVITQDNCPSGSGCATYPVPPNPFPLSGGITVTGPCATKQFSVNVTGCSGGTVTWYFGDGNTASGSSVSHTYTQHGAFSVTAEIVCNGCTFQVYKTVNVPLLADFNYSITCGANGSYTVVFNNTSQTLGGWTYNPLTDVVWTSGCGTPLSGSGNMFTLNTPANCNPTVTMDITVNNPVTGDICMDSKTITLNLPTAPLSINVPAVVCKNETYTFNYSWTGPNIIQHAWTVAVNAGTPVPVSQQAVLNYAFGSVDNYTIGLTVTDIFGCTFTASNTFSVVMPQPLTLTPVMICPDCLPPTVLSATPTSGFANYQWYHNGMAITGANSATYQLCQFDASGNYYVTAEDTQSNNCMVTSNTVAVTYHPTPRADIQGSTILCVPGNGPYSVSLSNAGGNNLNYTYNWTAMGPGAVTFSPDNLQYNANATVTTLGTYEFILTVTDVTTGCMAKDTFCIYLCANPTVTVSGPVGGLCAGKPHTFTASATPAGNYVYVWSNGATGPVMTTSSAGLYSVTATDTDCGCSDNTYAGFITQSPSAILFPVGCDTICDRDSIVPPLALGGPWVAGGYVVQWFLNSNFSSPFFTGPVLNLTGNIPPLVYGMNDISIVVTYNGCSDTSNVYNLFIKKCCVCHSDLTITHSGIDYPVFCNPHMGFIPSLPCPADDVIISGFHGFVDEVTGDPCEETVVTWELQKPDGSTTGGTSTNYANFIFPKDSVSQPGLYCLTLTTISPDGLDTCVCKATWIREPCDCCTTLEDFCDRLENNVILSVDNNLCKVTLSVGNLPPCDFIEWIDWGDQNQVPGPPAGGMAMHTYSAAGTYVVCYLAVERDANGSICFEKLVCDTITVKCPDCFCGTFSHLYMPLKRIILVTPLFCDSAEVAVGCPAPGNSLPFTGFFQCAGPNCPPAAPITWALYRLPNTVIPVASGSTTANPFFGINILPAWYATPGSYELHLVGHCGQQDCPCIVRFRVDCPDPCPCTPADVQNLSAAVSQGFSVVKYPASCKACFAPVALSDCEQVVWRLNDINGPIIGVSVGSGGICHTFSGAGSYTVVMIVTRKKSDGTDCEIFVESQTVNMTCLTLSECTDSDFPNAGFALGAIPGGILSEGASTGWTAAEGEPVVTEGQPGSVDAWTIELSGNFDAYDILTTADSACMETDTGMIVLHGSYRMNENQRPTHQRVVIGASSGDHAVTFASIPFELMESSERLEIEVPFDLSYWPDLEACGTSGNGVWVRPFVYVTNTLVNEQGGEATHSVAHLDDVCINGRLVTGVHTPTLKPPLRIYPNPNSGAFTLELPQAAMPGMRFRILGLTGQVVLEKTAEAGSARQALEAGLLPAGMYYIQVMEAGRIMEAGRFVKQ